MASILSTGISALAAFQQQLTTTGHNIANVNTEGFSRQRVDLDVRPPEVTGAGFLGNGVEATAIRRSYDEFLAGQVRDFTSSHEEFLVFHERAAQIDNVIGQETAGIDRLLGDFFAGMQDVADDPTSIPARQVLLNRAASLADRFNALDGWLQDLRNQVNGDFSTFSREMSDLAQGIASMNNRIQVAQTTGARVPNDLLDQRDLLVDRLAEYTSVSTLNQDDGSLNVFIGTGQALVVGSTFNQLTVANNREAADHREIFLQQSGGTAVNITDQMTGGRLGGLLRFRDQALDPAQNALGRVAIGLASTFNAEHATGLDLDGDAGGDFFRLAQPEKLANPANAGDITVTFDDVADLGTDEYQLSFNGAWGMVNLTTGAALTLSGTGTALDPLVGAGMSIVANAATANGDTYRLRPTRLGAGSIATLVSNVRDIAAGELAVAENVAGNTGTGGIGFGAQTTVDGTSLAALPIGLQFDAANARFDLSSGGTLAYDPTTDSGKAQTLNIAGLGDFTFTVQGTPDNGDSFRIGANVDGSGRNLAPGDNRNALRLADLQTANSLIGNAATLADAYAQMIADVGTRTRQAELNENVQSELLDQATANKAAVSGVNLDEEAANLIRFQQAFQAAAQVINTANTLFDTLLGAVRR